MARFDIRATAAALEIDEHWLGITLTRFAVVGVARGRRGVTRTLSLDAVVCLGIAYALVHDAGMGVEPALDVAHRLLRAPGGQVLFARGALRLAVDVEEARRTARLRLAHAVELNVEPRRGRPPARRAPRL